MDSGYADINGLHLYYEIHGDGGTPLVLLHGGVMTIDLTYASLLPALALGPIVEHLTKGKLF